MRLDLFSGYNSAYDIGNGNQFVLTLIRKKCFLSLST